MSVLLELFRVILEVMVPFVWEKSREPDTAVVADRDSARAERLRKRVREHKNGAGT